MIKIEEIKNKKFQFALGSSPNDIYFLITYFLLFSTLYLGNVLIGLTVKQNLLNTVTLFSSITIFGFYICNKLPETLNDPKLKIMGDLWLFKIWATLILLYAGWIPMLDPLTSTRWGYDPQRYFQDARILIEEGWNPVVGSNYQGILFFYAGIFYVFGHNPVIPAIINAFISLLGVVYLVKFAYQFNKSSTTLNWTVSLIILIPELLWYDVMTSRESLMAVLIFVTTLSVAKYMLKTTKIVFVTLLASILAIIAILAIRTTMIIPVIFSIALMAYLIRSKQNSNGFKKIALIGITLASFSLGPIIQKITGGYNINYFQLLNKVQSFESNVASQMEWADGSIGLLLAPDNLLESICFLPPRMIIYILAPLPKIRATVNGLFDGSWADWQYIMTVSTSVLMLIGFPFVLAGSFHVWKNRRNMPNLLPVPIIFWLTFATVAGGNIIIHERYRVMFTPLFFYCIWIGLNHSNRKTIKMCFVSWIGVLSFGIFFYLSYKFI